VRSVREDQIHPHVSAHATSSNGQESVQDVYCCEELVIGAVLLQDEDRKVFPVAYVSQCLLDAETWYVFMEKLCLSLYYTCSMFRHYILFSSCTVACQYDVIKHISLKLILSGRVGKWAYALVEYDLAYNH
jgi:hypothetical protein